jgi:hypothetical protein
MCQELKFSVENDLEMFDIVIGLLLNLLVIESLLFLEGEIHDGVEHVES